MNMGVLELPQFFTYDLDLFLVFFLGVLKL
jgi:hypothetical protein